MSDLDMCMSKECPVRETCHRFTAPINPYQQYYSEFTFNPITKCDYYLDNKGYSREKKDE